MRLARDLQNSGSDIVIEEDLADVFGRCKISGTMASSFKTVVNKSGTAHMLCEGIALQTGPGPTVVRALQSVPYFATVIQCSFLTGTHEKVSLAAAVSQAFEKRMEDAPPNSILRNPPTQDGILGFLTACEDQTSSFNWDGLLLAVAGTLGYKPDWAFETLPEVILRGSLDIFPLIQSLPSDRLAYIKTGQGVCALVVWAHHILGLRVLVQQFDKQIGHCTDIRFGGPNEEQIVIDPRGIVDDQIREPSIVLLDAKQECLFTLKPDPDESLIDAVHTIPALGYGKAVLQKVAHDYLGKIAVIEELQSFTTALAGIMGNHLVMDRELILDDDSIDDDSSGINCPVEPQRVMEAATFIFGNTRIDEGQASLYRGIYSSQPLTPEMTPPPAIQAAMRSQVTGEGAEIWQNLLYYAKHLAILILAFAHVQDLSCCADLSLCRAIELLKQTDLSWSLHLWDGKGMLRIKEDAWFHTFILLLVGHRAENLDRDSIALISDRGWSIYLSTLGKTVPDPTFTGQGYLAIRKGVPVRNGVWKHGIIDGPSQKSDTCPSNEHSEWQLVNAAGETVALRCAEKVQHERPLCGERGDQFVVSLRIGLHVKAQNLSFHDKRSEQVYYRRTGFRELHMALWRVQKAKPCTHMVKSDDQITLPPACATVSGFGDNEKSDLDERIVICLTARQSPSRWRALLAIASTRDLQDASTWDQVLLRGEDTCFQCVVDQAAVQEGRWYIVL
jgi:hypothetical protein